MKPAEILRGAAELLSTPGAWTQGVFARNAAGRHMGAKSADAVCWCAYGAIERVTHDGGGSQNDAWSAGDALKRVIPRRHFRYADGVVAWQDMTGRTAEEVVAKLIEAAEILEKAP